MDSDGCKEKTLDLLAKSSDEGKRNIKDAGDIAKAAKKQKQETDTSNEFGTPEEEESPDAQEEEREEEVSEEKGNDDASKKQLEPNTSKPQEVLLLRNTHTVTSNCRHSIKKFLQDMDEIEAVEIPDDLDQPIEAVVVGKLDAKEVRERFKATKYNVIVTEQLVDCEDQDVRKAPLKEKELPLKEKEFTISTAYIKNFNFRVGESVSGTVGNRVTEKKVDQAVKKAWVGGLVGHKESTLNKCECSTEQKASEDISATKQLETQGDNICTMISDGSKEGNGQDIPAKRSVGLKPPKRGLKPPKRKFIGCAITYKNGKPPKRKFIGCAITYKNGKPPKRKFIGCAITYKNGKPPKRKFIGCAITYKNGKRLRTNHEPC